MKKPTVELTPVELVALVSGNVENFLAASTPGGIEAQEKQGQLQQLQVQTLPKDGTSGGNRANFEKLGFVFGDDADCLFVNVKFPAGWRKASPEHDNSYWTDLVDEKGRVRGSIFYKAAFYDRRASVSLRRRYDVSASLPEKQIQVHVYDSANANEIVQRFGPLLDRYDSTVHPAYGEADAWLNTKFPDWRDPVAYWDEVQ